MSAPWDDGVLTKEEFEELLRNDGQKEEFANLPLQQQHDVLHASAPEGSGGAEKLDRLAKYLHGWFRKTALKRAAKMGLSEQDTENLIKAWTYEE